MRSLSDLNPLGIGHFLFYFTVLSTYAYAIVFDTELFWGGKYAKVGFPFDDSFGGRAKFLTYNNLALQMVFFFFSASSALYSVMGNAKMAGNMRRLTNFLFTSFAFPIGMLVSIAFWTLYFIDRKLVFPLILDTIMPVWLNHALHTLPLVSLSIELCVTKHSYTTFVKGAFYNAAFVLAYISWTLFIAHQTDKWVYGVLKQLSPLFRGLFMAANAMFSVFMYKIGELLNSWIWSQPIKVKQ